MTFRFFSGFLAGIVLVVSVWFFIPDIKDFFFHDKELQASASLTTPPVTTNEEEIKKAPPEEKLIERGAEAVGEKQTSTSPAKGSGVGESAALSAPGEPLEEAPGNGSSASVSTEMLENGAGSSSLAEGGISWAEVERPVSDDMAGAGGATVKSDNGVKKASKMVLDATGVTADSGSDFVKVPEGAAAGSDGKVSIDMDSDINGTSMQTGLSAGAIALTEGAKEKFYFWKPFFLESKAKSFAEQVTSISKVDCQVDKSASGDYQVYYRYSDEVDKLAKADLIKQIGISF